MLVTLGAQFVEPGLDAVDASGQSGLDAVDVSGQLGAEAVGRLLLMPDNSEHSQNDGDQLCDGNELGKAQFAVARGIRAALP